MDPGRILLDLGACDVCEAWCLTTATYAVRRFWAGDWAERHIHVCDCCLTAAIDDFDNSHPGAQWALLNDRDAPEQTASEHRSGWVPRATAILAALARSAVRERRQQYGQ